MIRISPFKALRPLPEAAPDIISVPYDVVDTEEARNMAQGKPLSFLRVIRSEIEFPPGADPYGSEIYARARENLHKLLEDGHLIRETEDCFFIYRLEHGGRSQTGVVARIHAEEYFNGRVKRHELTRPEKEKDRTEHVDRTGANTGPVFMAYRSDQAPGLTDYLEQLAGEMEPLYDIQREDDVRHKIYRVEPGPEQDRLQELYSGLDCVYIADGHHRAASAANVCRLRQERFGQGNSEDPHNWFLCVSFPDEQLSILPYNRAVRDLNGLKNEEFLELLEKDFTLVPGKQEVQKREINLYLGGKWTHLKAKEHATSGTDEISGLDVSILQERILGPILGIDDPRLSDRIKFVGGIRGDEELERLVDEGRYAVSFSMHPTSMNELLAVADADKIMPPKSTWFEPKLCSGFLINPLD